ncbi:MAG: XRE family transcriptional regulator [Oscillospiraceae bacterium]|nr:XRE family transcriptional regulator [Oscillospiraceae bacterium]
MAEYTPFGLAVKTKLLNPPRTQEWLVNEINKDTGMNVDGPYVSKILRGTRKSERVTASICRILDIPAPTE